MKDNYCSQCGAKQKEKTSLKLGDNLEVTHYQNGDSIPLAISNEQWLKFGKKGVGAVSINKNGNYLYNWYAVNDNRGLAPKGWRIPTDNDWYEVEEQLRANPTYSGYRNFYNGSYIGIGNYGYFWSSSEGNSYYAWYRVLDSSNASVYRTNYDKLGGFSVRCVKEK